MNYSDYELNSIKDHTAELLPHFLSPAHKNGYICPCGNGSGDDGTSIDIMRDNPHVIGKCFKCGKSFDIFGVVQRVEGIKFDKAV